MFSVSDIKETVYPDRYRIGIACWDMWSYVRWRFGCLCIIRTGSELLFNLSCRLSPIGINLQGPILCWLQHGEILKQKSWPKNELTKNPNSTFVSDSGFFVSKRSTFLLKNYQPWVRMHKIGPCKFIPAVSHAIIIKWRTNLLLRFGNLA